MGHESRIYGLSHQHRLQHNVCRISESRGHCNYWNYTPTTNVNDPGIEYKYAEVISDKSFCSSCACLTRTGCIKPKNGELATMTMSEFFVNLGARISSFMPALKDKLAKTDLGQQYLDARLKNREFLMAVVDKIEAYTQQA
ncbi:hypothetical protein PHET_01327 [Paragonimus heterotremus]|uniref:Uncharacterized protein n=1 Tax=Paragonimus heterotremus TaxID=100268 RepID=A0A8J4SSG7_9TREM|nr:hypothetical protein PHET_01327 [Paragonimus heterotremus]